MAIENINTNNTKQPSIIRQIVDEVDALDKGEQENILLELKRKRIQKRLKEIVKKLNGCETLMTEEEIAELESKDRKERYEQSLSH